MRTRPILKCYSSINESLVKAWCPFCQEWHHHRFTSDIADGRKSHRVEHCTDPDSPFRLTGYYLQLMNRGEIEEIVHGPVAGAYTIGSNPILDFWRKMCEFGTDYEEEAIKLFDRHKEWFKENKQQVLSRNQFANELIKRPGVCKRKHGTTRRVIYTGIRLKCDDLKD